MSVVLPDTCFNLFGASAFFKNDWKLHGDSEKIWIIKVEKKIVFDIKIKTPHGALYCIKFHQYEVTDEVSNLSAAVTVAGKKME